MYELLSLALDTSWWSLGKSDRLGFDFTKAMQDFGVHKDFERKILQCCSISTYVSE